MIEYEYQEETDMGFYGDLKELLSKKRGLEFEPKKDGSHSFCFKGSGGLNSNYNRTLNCVKNVFLLDKKFNKYFKEATSGSGNEALKINTIWSSSLLSLLFFYSTVIKNRGIVFPDKKLEGVVFTKCHFEFKNPVRVTQDNNHPSNIDCVLMDDSKKHLLFIESKFIEYKRDFRRKGPQESDVLKGEYEDDYTRHLYNWYKGKLNEKPFKGMYCYGAKQMITHYSGLCNFINGAFHPNMENSETNRSEIIDAFVNNKPSLYLIEVVYDLSNVGGSGKYKKWFDSYQNVQTEMIKIMNDGKAGFEVLEMVTYQSLLKENMLDETIKSFYFPN